MTVNQNNLGRSFWLRWMIATTIGFVIGGAVSGALVNAAEVRFAGVTSALIGAIALASADAVAFGLLGAALGSAQWFVLRDVFAWPGTWIAANAGGWAAAGVVSGILGGAFGGALTGVGPDYGRIGVVIAYGSGFGSLLIPGFFQWLALRRQVKRAGWWVAAQFLSFLAANAVAFPIMLVASGPLGWELPSAQAWGFLGILAGLIYGSLTGAVMARLLGRPRPSASVRLQANSGPFQF
jgi:hypothetical protein